MSTATMMERPDAAEWHRWRRSGIGASDMPKILGLSRYGTALSVYLEKIGEGEAVEETEAMELGTAAEPMIAALYQRRTGRVLATSQHRATHDTIPFLRATLDGVTTCRRNVQMKTTGGADTDEYGEEGTDEIPRHVLAQIHHEMLVADLPVTDVPVLLGRHGLRFAIYTVGRDPEWDAVIIEAGRRFHDAVLSRTPPEPVFPDDNRNLARLFKPSGVTITLTHGASAEAFRREEIRRQIKDLQDEADAITAHLRMELGEASLGELSDGRVLKRQVKEVAERTQTVKAHRQDYLQLIRGAK